MLIIIYNKILFSTWLISLRKCFIDADIEMIRKMELKTGIYLMEMPYGEKLMEDVKKSFFRSKIILLPMLFFIIGTVILGILGYNVKKSQDDLSHSRVKLNAMTYAQHMQLDIMQGINITNTLEQVIVSNDGDIQKFPEIAEDMMKDFLQSIQVAPGGVVTDIYPAAGNDAGKIDLIHDKDRGRISCYARDNDVITMQGPFDLKQGGSGIAIRNPVYLEGADGEKEFWGFTIAIIRVPEIFSESIEALSEFGYDYKLSKNVSPWDETFQEVYGSGADMKDAATYSFDLGDSHWKLEVQPKSGWSSNKSLYMMLGCGILIILLTSGLIAVLMLFNKTKTAERQTAELNSELHEALEQVNIASHAKSKFISSMSHDMRTPMNAIMGYTTIALNRKPEEKIKECLERIDESSRHLLTLINDVLEISRIESGKVRIEQVRINISDVVDEVSDIIRGLTVGRTLKFEAKRTELENPYVMADGIRIREIMVNILSNAVKFTKDGGTVKFTTDYRYENDQQDITAIFTVSDTGIGMSEEFQKHMFEEFAQENSNARTRYNGTGLGLPIAARYVEMMGGRIDIMSKKGVGTTVTVEIPMQTAHAENDKIEKKNTVSTDISGLHLLMAEDNELNAEIAKTLLEEEGADITVVRNGRQAVDAFADSPAGTFDAILMDVMMPVMDGLAATREIRSMDRPDAKTVPVIAMTANAFAEDIRKCLDVGMNAHLAKPLDMENVKRTICEQINEHSGTHNNADRTEI